jgi:hypothetical protein
MIIKFINKEGNFQDLETNTDRTWESKVEIIGNTWFEKKPVIENKKKVVIEEPKEEVVEEVKEFDEVKAKEFLKEKKVRGFGLLKGEKLKERAIAEGFIC